MTTHLLPTPRTFITSLFKQLETLSPIQSDQSPSNTLINSDPAIKNVFLTLHCLFPNELLPALDLLDRSLVTRFVIEPASQVGLGDNATGEVKQDNVVYYVRSAQTTRPSRYQSVAAVGGISYEVRLRAWNCSCPAFTFSALNGLGIIEISEGMEMVYGDAAKTEGEWRFGGLLRGEDGVPICKHLLSCVLIEKCSLFRNYIEERSVTQEEAAGWAAGWGG